jgi:hypothetical protein
MKLGHKGHLNTRNKFQKKFFPNPKISLPILNELEEYRLEPWIHSKVGGR